MRLINRNNEVLVFLFNFFMLETVGRLLVLGLIHLLRYFGLHQLYYLYYGHRMSGHWLFAGLLVIALIISLGRLMKRRREIKRKMKDS